MALEQAEMPDEMRASGHWQMRDAQQRAKETSKPVNDEILHRDALWVGKDFKVWLDADARSVVGYQSGDQNLISATFQPDGRVTVKILEYALGWQRSHIPQYRDFIPVTEIRVVDSLR